MLINTFSLMFRTINSIIYETTNREKGGFEVYGSRHSNFCPGVKGKALSYRLIFPSLPFGGGLFFPSNVTFKEF